MIVYTRKETVVSANVTSSAESAPHSDASQVRVLPVGTRSGERDGVADVVHALESLPRVLRLYPSSHNRIKSHLDRLTELLGHSLRAGGALELVVDGKELRAGDAVLDGQTAAALALRLRLRGLACVRFLPGITQDELVGTAEVLLEEPMTLLRHEGGAAGRLAQTGPNVEAEAARESLTDEETDGGDPECGIARKAIRLLRRLCARALKNQAPTDSVGLIEDIVIAFLNENKEVEPRVLQRAMREFLASFETVLAAELENGALSLEDCARSLLAESLDAVKQSDSEQGAAEISYELIDPTALSAKGALAQDMLMRSMAEHDPATTAFLIHCELLAGATTRPEYEAGCRRIVNAVGNLAYKRDAVATGIAWLRQKLVPRHGHAAEKFLHGLIPITADPVAAAALLVDLDREDWLEAQQVARLIAMRPDAFVTYTRLLAEPLTPSLKTTIAKSLLQLAEAKPGKWKQHVARASELLLRDGVVETLMDATPKLLCEPALVALEGACKQTRARFIAQMVRCRGGAALRLLALGMTYDDSERDAALLTAFGEFDSALAVTLLRESIHRCNAGKYRPREAEAAIAALRRCRSNLAEDFLHAVVETKTLGMSAFRKELRALAAVALKGRVR